jgi:hypothetical protein
MITRSHWSSRRRPSSALPDFVVINNRAYSPIGAGSKRSNLFDLHLLYIGRRGGSGFGRCSKKNHAPEPTAPCLPAGWAGCNIVQSATE